MRRLILAALAALLLAAGSCEPAPDGQDTPDSAMTQPTTESACLSRGGSWGRGGLLPEEICILPARDAGKSCQSNSDCDSVCLAQGRPAQGVCAPTSPYFGCFETFDHGQKAMLCVD